MDLLEDVIIILKVIEFDKEVYLGFEGMNFVEIFRENGVEKVYICGVVIEYCVKVIVFDVVRYGFEIYFLSDVVKGINFEDEKKVFEEMKRVGVKIL